MNYKDTFFDRLESKYIILSKKQILLADYLRDNYKTAVFLACVPLAKEVGVSEATVVRFANALGYEGFTDMINHIQDYMKNEMMTTVDKLKNLELQRNYSHIFNELIHNNIQVLSNFVNFISQEKIDCIVDNMSKSKRIVVNGFESSAGFAEYLSYHLIRAGCYAEIISEKYGNLYNIINSSDKDTFVITVIFPRYPDEQVKLNKMLHEKGSKICLITDSAKCTLSSVSDYHIYIPFQNSQSFDMGTHIAILTLLQIILYEYCLKDYDKIKSNLENLEKFNEYFNIFNK
jgi:DNA-binding MurR/RpiR family transcriptional regulator